MRYLSYFLLLCTVWLSSALAQTQKTDRDPQHSLITAVPNESSRRELSIKLKLHARLNVTAAYDEGTLAAKISALAPLVRADRSGQNKGRGVIKLDPKAYAALATIWRDGVGGAFTTPMDNLNIPVCWLKIDSSSERGRKLTQQAVMASWEHHGRVRFTNWQECQKDAKGIKIAIVDERPWSEYGTDASTKTPSMSLNFVFDDIQMRDCKETVDLCITSIAIHEFGHVLGLIHEQDSDKTPAWCRAMFHRLTPEKRLKAQMLTDWDEFSVMDYCLSIYKERLQLSDCDIAAYHRLYGKPAKVNYDPICRIK